MILSYFHSSGWIFDWTSTNNTSRYFYLCFIVSIVINLWQRDWHNIWMFTVTGEIWQAKCIFNIKQHTKKEAHAKFPLFTIHDFLYSSYLFFHFSWSTYTSGAHTYPSDAHYSTWSYLNSIFKHSDKNVTSVQTNHVRLRLLIWVKINTLQV